MKMLALSAALLLPIFGATFAQAPDAKQKTLDAITSRAQDPKNPQAPSATEQQLNDWATQFSGSIQHTVVDDPDATGRTPPIARARTVCKTTTKNGHTCRLVKAEQTGNGKMTCTYACS
jgi:hypothetical protein